jgi:hypothetical protein
MDKNPQVHRWFIPRIASQCGVASWPPTFFNRFAIFFMQL